LPVSGFENGQHLGAMADDAADDDVISPYCGEPGRGDPGLLGRSRRRHKAHEWIPPPAVLVRRNLAIA
jgi:hypothetical protein